MQIGPRCSRLLAGAWLACCALGAAAALADAPPAQGEARFTATGPAGLKIEGKSPGLRATADDQTVTCTLELTSFVTGIDLRDRHLQDHLESAAFPVATLTVPRAALKFPEAGADTAGDAQGQLSFHGQVKPVTFSYKATRADGVQVSASLRIDIRDFGLVQPSYLGLTVRPMVDVAVDFRLADGK